MLSEAPILDGKRTIRSTSHRSVIIKTFGLNIYQGTLNVLSYILLKAFIKVTRSRKNSADFTKVTARLRRYCRCANVVVMSVSIRIYAGSARRPRQELVTRPVTAWLVSYISRKEPLHLPRPCRCNRARRLSP